MSVFLSFCLQDDIFVILFNQYKWTFSRYYLQGSSSRQCLVNGWTGRSMCLGKFMQLKPSHLYILEDFITWTNWSSLVDKDWNFHHNCIFCSCFVAVSCGNVPQVPHSVMVSNVTQNLKFKEVIEYRCEDNYTLVGNGSVVCQEDRTYSSLPQCKGESSFCFHISSCQEKCVRRETRISVTC